MASLARKASANQLLAESPKVAELCRRRPIASSLLPRPCRPSGLSAPIRDASERTGDKQRQNQRRGFPFDSSRETQPRFGRGPRSGQIVVVKGLIHHRRLEDAHHRCMRWPPAQVADPMGHVAAIAQRLAGACLGRRSGDLDLELAVEDRQTLDRPAQMGGRFRARRQSRRENRTIGASRRSSASRSPPAGTIRRRRRRLASFPGRDAR